MTGQLALKQLLTKQMKPILGGVGGWLGVGKGDRVIIFADKITVESRISRQGSIVVFRVYGIRLLLAFAAYKYNMVKKKNKTKNTVGPSSTFLLIAL